jgi:hypothetical protein
MVGSMSVSFSSEHEPKHFFILTVMIVLMMRGDGASGFQADLVFFAPELSNPYCSHHNWVPQQSENSFPQFNYGWADNVDHQEHPEISEAREEESH